MSDNGLGGKRKVKITLTLVAWVALPPLQCLSKSVVKGQGLDDEFALLAMSIGRLRRKQGLRRPPQVLSLLEVVPHRTSSAYPRRSA